MAEELKGLIEKIQQEGIDAARASAKRIEDEAKHKATVIIEDARRQAQQLISEAKREIATMEASSKVSLKQAGRDLILLLRKEINEMLDKLLISKVRQALTPAELIKIIASLVKEYSREEEGEVVISLNKEDLEKVQKGLLSELKEAAKKGIVLKASQDIHGGFIISYDGGKSHFDFTDKALAEFLNRSLKPSLEGLLETGKD